MFSVLSVCNSLCGSEAGLWQCGQRSTLEGCKRPWKKPTKMVKMLALLHTNAKSILRVNGQHYSIFKIKNGVREGCIPIPCMFNTVIDHVMGGTSAWCICGSRYGEPTWYPGLCWTCCWVENLLDVYMIQAMGNPPGILVYVENFAILA